MFRNRCAIVLPLAILGFLAGSTGFTTLVEAAPSIRSAKPSAITLQPGGPAVSVLVQGSELEGVRGAKLVGRGRASVDARVRVDSVGRGKLEISIQPGARLAAGSYGLVVADKRGELRVPVRVVVVAAGAEAERKSRKPRGPDKRTTPPSVPESSQGDASRPRPRDGTVVDRIRRDSPVEAVPVLELDCIDRSGRPIACPGTPGAGTSSADTSVITTISGDGSGIPPGSNAGCSNHNVATYAQTPRPTALARANDGTIYIGTSTGTICTLIGTEQSRLVSGPTPGERFGVIRTLSVEPNGNLLFYAHADHRIWRVDGSGDLSVVAGTGQSGPTGDGGSATAARLASVEDIESLPDGGFLIASRIQNDLGIVRRVFPDGTIDTISHAGWVDADGNQVAPPASGSTSSGISRAGPTLMWPQGGISLLPGGGGYLIAEDRRVIRYPFDGPGEVVAGTGSHGYASDGQPAKTSRFWQIEDVVALGNGVFLIAEAGHHRVRLIDSNGVIKTLAGSDRGTGYPQSGLGPISWSPSTGGGYAGDGGPGTSARLRAPWNLVSLPNGDILIADRFNNRVRKLDVR